MLRPYYQDDYCTIYHGDCAVVLPTLEPVDLVLTDPPYGIKRFQQKDGGISKKIKNFDNTTNWNNKKPKNNIFEAMFKISSYQIIFGMNNFQLPTTEYFIVWDKRQLVPSFAECELIYTNYKVPARILRHRFINHNKQHPAEKPLLLIQQLLVIYGKDAKSILDPFMGSGTTLLAAKNLQRKAIGIELEEKYCEIAANRLRQEVLGF
jgi:site-specific DNA-methyltransferase (adenine-specific)